MAAFAVGFIIAMVIGLAGFGGGTVGTPLLILILRMKGAVAVGTALTFTAIVQLLVAPLYIARRDVDYGVLGWMLLGGMPGVFLGGRALISVGQSFDQKLLFVLLGTVVVVAAGLNVIRLMRASSSSGRDRPRWLAPLMLPVGIETGFSSAGSGALGLMALLGFTRLEGSQVVGTGLCFGLAVTSIGSVLQIFAGNFDSTVLPQLLVGGIGGGFAGTVLAQRLPSRILKYGLVAFLTMLGFQLIVRGLA